MSFKRSLSVFMLKTVDNMKIYLINLNFKFKFIDHDDMTYHERSK